MRVYILRLMSNFQKGFTPILVLIVFSIIVLVGAGIYNLNKTKFSTPKESTNIVVYPSPMVIPTIDPSIKINYDLREIPLEQDLQEAEYTKIPGTDLELKIPNSYKLRKNDRYFNDNHIFTARTDIKQLGRDHRICEGDSRGHTYLDRADYADWIEPYLTQAYCHAFMATNPQELDSSTDNHAEFIILKITTNSSVNDWMLDNYHPQGENLRETSTWDGKGQQVTVNNNIFYAYIVGCCLVRDVVYFYPYNYQGTQLLLGFFDVVPEGKISDPFLDSILATLRKTN